MIYISNSTVFSTNADLKVNIVSKDGKILNYSNYDFLVRYPYLKDLRKSYNVGESYFYPDDKVLVVCVKTDIKYKTQQEWLENILLNFKFNYKSYNIKSAAFPILDFERVEESINLVKKYLSDLPIDIYICKLEEMDNKERLMVKDFKSTRVDSYKKIIGLNDKQTEYLEKKKWMIERFKDILDIPSIGEAKYLKINEYFYNYTGELTYNLFNMDFDESD